MDIRQEIIDELERQGRPRVWLARQMKERDVCSVNQVYIYLRGENDARGRILGEMLDALGIRLAPGQRVRVVRR